jgi:hypothetical protein
MRNFGCCLQLCINMYAYLSKNRLKSRGINWHETDDLPGGLEAFHEVFFIQKTEICTTSDFREISLNLVFVNGMEIYLVI